MKFTSDKLHASFAFGFNLRGYIMVVHVTPDAANRAVALLETMRRRIEAARGVGYPGRGSPSSGWLSVFLAGAYTRPVFSST